MAIAARDKRGRAQAVKKGRKENPLFFTSMFHLLCPRCAINKAVVFQPQYVGAISTCKGPLGRIKSNQ